MQNENRQSKRIMALMPEEEPVFLRSGSAQYSAKLVNISTGGALISILDCNLDSPAGDRCGLFFTNGNGMFGVKGEVIRTAGRYAAFKFVEMNEEKACNVAGKIARMDSLSSGCCPTPLLS